MQAYRMRRTDNARCDGAPGGAASTLGAERAAITCVVAEARGGFDASPPKDASPAPGASRRSIPRWGSESGTGVTRGRKESGSEHCSAVARRKRGSRLRTARCPDTGDEQCALTPPSCPTAAPRRCRRPARIDSQLEPHRRLDHPFAVGEGAEAAIGRGDHALAVADRAHRLLDAARHHFRVLDEIAGGLDHARDQQHVLRQRMLLERGVFVRVARIGELDRQRADLGLVERRQNLAQRDVVDVRAFPVAVADMQPHAVARNAVDAVVDRRDVPLDRLDEIARPTGRGTSWCGPWRDRARRSAGSARPCGSPGIRCFISRAIASR